MDLDLDLMNADNLDLSMSNTIGSFGTNKFRLINDYKVTVSGVSYMLKSGQVFNGSVGSRTSFPTQPTSEDATIIVLGTQVKVPKYILTEERFRPLTNNSEILNNKIITPILPPTPSPTTTGDALSGRTGAVKAGEGKGELDITVKGDIGRTNAVKAVEGRGEGLVKAGEGKGDVKADATTTSTSSSSTDTEDTKGSTSKKKDSDEEEEKSEKKFYQTYWFWGIIGAVVIGGGIGAYYLLKKK